MPSPGKLLTVRELQELFPQLGRDAIYGLLMTNELSGVKVAGRWVTTPEAVDNWLNRITYGTNGPEALDISEVDPWRRS